MQPIDLNCALMRIVKDGSVTLFGTRYQAGFLAALEGQRVVVEYQIVTGAAVRVFTGQPPQLLGEAQAQVDQDLFRTQLAAKAASEAGPQHTVSDTCQLDVLVTQDDGKAYRPTLTVTADAASGAITGWQVGAPQAMTPSHSEQFADPRAKGAVERFFREFARILPPPKKQPLTLRSLVELTKAFLVTRNNNLKWMG